MFTGTPLPHDPSRDRTATVRSLIWIALLSLAGAAALWYARRLAADIQPVPAAAPAATTAESGASPARPVELADPGVARTALEVPPPPTGDALLPASLQPAALEGGPMGLEDGGEPRAARPLPDFGSKHAHLDATQRADLARELAAEIRGTYGALPRHLQEDLRARLEHRAPAAPPDPQVGALLERIDEREWLRRSARRASTGKD